jgi:hypothetical protein
MQRLTRARREHFISRATNVQQAAGNPLGAEVRQFGDLTAILLRREPRLFPNLAIGLTPGGEDVVQQARHWYQRNHQRWELEVVPAPDHAPLLEYLHAHKFYQCSFANVLYGVPAHMRALVFSGVMVREVEAGEFARAIAEMDNVPEPERAKLIAVRAAEFAQDWRCYLGYLDGVPAARAAMWLKDGVAVLGFAETLPAFRTRGGQTALIRHRIAEAARAGCDLLTAQTPVGLSSQRNMERAGLRLAFTKVNWKLRD